MSSAEYHFEVPIAAPSLTNQREHWRARSRRARVHRQATWGCYRQATQGRRLLDGETAVVTLTRCGPRALDDDNLPASLKSVRDQLAAELGVDDASPRVQWLYAQTRQEAHGVGVSIWIT